MVNYQRAISRRLKQFHNFGPKIRHPTGIVYGVIVAAAAVAVHNMLQLGEYSAAVLLLAMIFLIVVMNNEVTYMDGSIDGLLTAREITDEVQRDMELSIIRGLH